MAPKEAWTFGSLKLSVLVKEAACCASTATGDVARRAVTVGVRGVVLVSSKPNGAIAIQRGIGISLADSVRCVGGHHERVCNSELVFCLRLISSAGGETKGGRRSMTNGEIVGDRSVLRRAWSRPQRGQ